MVLSLSSGSFLSDSLVAFERFASFSQIPHIPFRAVRSSVRFSDPPVTLERLAPFSQIPPIVHFEQFLALSQVVSSPSYCFSVFLLFLKIILSSGSLFNPRFELVHTFRAVRSSFSGSLVTLVPFEKGSLRGSISFQEVRSSFSGALVPLERYAPLSQSPYVPSSGLLLLPAFSFERFPPVFSQCPVRVERFALPSHIPQSGWLLNLRFSSPLRRVRSSFSDSVRAGETFRKGPEILR